MSNRMKKKEELMDREALDELLSSESASSASRGTEPRRIRKVSPLGMRVLVKIRKESNVSEGGLYLPEGAKSAMAESVIAEVLEVAVASDHSTDEEANISGIPLGSVVLIGKNAGVRVPWDEALRIVETKEVLAIIHELSVV